jgi:hypothetical protein
LGTKPLISQLNMPDPSPFVVIPVCCSMVGPEVVRQTTPLAVMLPPPSLLMFPPLLAVAVVIMVISRVLILGGRTGSSFLHDPFISKKIPIPAARTKNKICLTVFM